MTAATMQEPLVLAVPSKGRLQENAFAFFARAGLTFVQGRGTRSRTLHGGRFGVSKPATQQPVKDVRSGAQAPALNRAAGPHTQAVQAAESQT